jgi:hypothetical protein
LSAVEVSDAGWFPAFCWAKEVAIKAAKIKTDAFLDIIFLNSRVEDG